jgi:hypothetical protein
MKFYLLVLLLFFQLIFCQDVKQEQIIAEGILNFSTFTGEVIDNYNCGLKYLSEIEQGEVLTITGVKECVAQNNNSLTKFFEIRYNFEYLFVEIDLLICDKDYYLLINNLSDSDKKKFRDNSTIYSDNKSKQRMDIEIREKNEIKEKFNNFLKNSTQQGLIVKKWKIIDESEYTDGTSIEIEFVNPTKKTIKYIWTTFVGYNAVEDPVIDRIKGVKNITVKSIGPIKPDESGLYTFEYVWYSDIVESAKITNIKIQYMDGTFKTISAPEKVIMTDSLLKILEEQD